MPKRPKEKEMGGAEKVRAKKKKELLKDAAKCAKLTDLFRGVGGADTVSQTSGSAASNDPPRPSSSAGSSKHCVCLHYIKLA